MKKINLLGIEVKANNKREVKLINIIKSNVKAFYKSYKDKPNSIKNAYYDLYGSIKALYFMDIITYEQFCEITDRFYCVYIFTDSKARNW